MVIPEIPHIIYREEEKLQYLFDFKELLPQETDEEFKKNIHLVNKGRYTEVIEKYDMLLGDPCYNKAVCYILFNRALARVKLAYLLAINKEYYDDIDFNDNRAIFHLLKYDKKLVTEVLKDYNNALLEVQRIEKEQREKKVK